MGMMASGADVKKRIFLPPCSACSADLGFYQFRRRRRVEKSRWMAHLPAPREDLGRRLTGCLMNKHARERCSRSIHHQARRVLRRDGRLSVHLDHRPRASSETYHYIGRPSWVSLFWWCMGLLIVGHANRSVFDSGPIKRGRSPMRPNSSAWVWFAAWPGRHGGGHGDPI